MDGDFSLGEWRLVLEKRAQNSDLFALQLNPEYQYTLGGGETVRYGFSLAAEVATDVKGNDPSPRFPFQVQRNYPNPFNPSTRIAYSIGKLGPVSVKIYDVAGRLVRVLVDDIGEPGVYNILWDGMNDSGRHVGSGIYFCMMWSGEFAETKKFILLR